MLLPVAQKLSSPLIKTSALNNFGIIPFFRPMFPKLAQEEMQAKDGKEAFPPRSRLRNTEQLTLISPLFRTHLFFQHVFVTHRFHQEACSLCTCCPSRLLLLSLSGKHGTKKWYDPNFAQSGFRLGLGVFHKIWHVWLLSWFDKNFSLNSKG